MKISFLSQSLISLAVLSACGGSAIGDAQDFSPNVPPVIMSLSAHNTDGTDVTIADIEPYKQLKLMLRPLMMTAILFLLHSILNQVPFRGLQIQSGDALLYLRPGGLLADRMSVCGQWFQTERVQE